MKQVNLALMLGGLVAASACQQANSQGLGEKLDAIDQRLASIEGQLKAGVPQRGNANPRNQPPAPARPNPADVYSVPVDGSPFKGSEKAKVTIVKAFEFACPYCERARPTMDQLLKDYKGDVKVVYKHFVVHPGSATIPAIAACAAGKQGKFGEMEAIIWEKGFAKAREGGLSQENIDKLANEIGLDMGAYKRDQEPCAALVRKDQAELSKVGTRGTPAFYINGRFISGAQPVENFKAVVDEELKKANSRIGGDGGTSLEGYYDEWVVKKGKSSI